MATPREILRRAEGKKQPPHPHPMPAPAPMQMPAVRSAPVQPAPAPVQAVQPPQPVQPVNERVVVPQPIRSNSVYHQLMASHDRMHTRHIKG